MTRTNCKTRRSVGIALIAVLWVIVLASLVLVGVQQAARYHHGSAYADLQRVQARWLARAGIERAVAVLAADSLADDTRLDYWYDDPLSFQEIALAEGYIYSVIAARGEDEPAEEPVRYGMTDLSSRVNINTADEAQLKALAELTDEQIAGILDWRDEDQEAHPGGAESEYYNDLRYPYRVSNRLFQTPRELMLVKDIDEATYLGADGVEGPALADVTTPYTVEPNKTGLSEDRVNINEADAATLRDRLGLTQGLAANIVSQRGNDPFDDVFGLVNVSAGGRNRDDEEGMTDQITLEWVAEHWDDLTVSRERTIRGLVNVNTAGRDVLLSLPQMDEKAADAIVSYRESSSGPFYGVGELFIKDLVTEEQFRAVAPRLTVRSYVFEATSRGRTPWGVEQTITAVLDRGGERVRVLYWHESD